MAQFGQLVIGPPGSGKTTYCRAMKRFMADRGRDTVIVNLDPANDPVDVDVDIRDLIQLSDVTERLQLGPNGGLIFCIEYLSENMQWLEEQLAGHKQAFVLLDCPGQVELFTHHAAFRGIVTQMQERWQMRLCCVNLVDGHHCYSQAKFVSALLTSLAAMIQLELPHVNVLSKIDLLDEEQLPHRIDTYTDVLDLEYLLDTIPDDPFAPRFRKLTEALASVVEDFGLVQFSPLNVQDSDSILLVMRLADKACGYLFEGS